MRVDVKLIGERKRVEEEAKRQAAWTDWPTKPLGARDETILTIDFVFFDGSTKRDPDDPSGFVVMDEYKGGATPIHDSTHTSSLLNAFNHTVTFKQNSNEITAEQIQAIWESDNPFDRRPLERYETTDLLENDNVMPVGTMKSNIEVVLKDTEGTELDTISAYKIIKGELPSEFTQTEGMGYRWLNPPPLAHIEVRERTAKSHYLMHMDHVAVQTQQAVYKEPFLSSSTYDYVMENIFWTPFDTSDSDNFKLTLEPRYDAEEFTGDHAVVIDSVYVEIDLILIPRWWWFYGRFMTSESQEIDYGIWSVPPKDFMMPTPRKTGTWDCNHPMTDDGYRFSVNFPSGSRFVDFDESNNRVRNTFTGDSEEDNGFYLLHAVPTLSVIWKLRGENRNLGNPSEGVIGGDGDTLKDSHTVAYKTGYREANVDVPGLIEGDMHYQLYEYYGYWEVDSEVSGGIVRLAFDSFCLYPHSNEGVVYYTYCGPAMTDGPEAPSMWVYAWDWPAGPIYIYWYYAIHVDMNWPMQFHLHGFWGSMSDGKVPHMTATGYHPGPIYPRWADSSDGPEVLAYDHNGFADSAAAGTDVIRDYFLEHPACGQQENPNSWMLSVAQAKEGDLVGVVVVHSLPLYIWRKTDEILNRENDSDPNDTLYLGNNWHWLTALGTYTLGAACPCIDVWNVYPQATFTTGGEFVGWTH
jgi:hypothetical protein